MQLPTTHFDSLVLHQLDQWGCEEASSKIASRTLPISNNNLIYLDVSTALSSGEHDIGLFIDVIVFTESTAHSKMEPYAFNCVGEF